MKKNPFEEGAVEYDLWFEKNSKIYDSELNALKLCFEENKKTIEIGVGTGVFAEKLGIKEGIEPSEDMAKIAKKRGIKVIKGVAEDLPLKDDSYEQVFMITVDCFLNNIDKAFSEIHRILKSGGIFNLAFINKDTKLGEIYEANKENDKNYKWADFRGAKEIIEILEKNGFEISESYNTIEDFEDRLYEVKKGYDSGVFTVIKAIAK